jgi:hypothetical protein
MNTNNFLDLFCVALDNFLNRMQVIFTNGQKILGF